MWSAAVILLDLTGGFFLQKFGQPIHDRCMEASERPKAFEELGRQIQKYTKILEAYKAKVTWQSINMTTLICGLFVH